MKTTKMIFALSLALVFAAGAITLEARKPAITKNAIPSHSRPVVFHVKIACTNLSQISGRNFVVAMTDQSGEVIGNPKAFNPCVSDYYFTEPGTVGGTRIARMIETPLGPHSFDIRPCVKTGFFNGGFTYLFVIVPLPWEKDARIDVH
jgi:hypothetical protein